MFGLWSSESLPVCMVVSYILRVARACPERAGRMAVEILTYLLTCFSALVATEEVTRLLVGACVFVKTSRVFLETE